METDPRVLVDFRTADDAGVYAWESGPALVQTVDFFTPIVDDPYVYGEIAAANALSDVYAMGGRPLTALAIAGVPRRPLDADDHRRRCSRAGTTRCARRRRSARRPHRARSRDQVRVCRDRCGLARSHLAQCRRSCRRRPAPHQAPRHGHRRHGHQVRTRAGRCGRTRRRRMRMLNRAAAEAMARTRRPRLYRHHRVRSARPRQRDGRGQRGVARARCRGRAALGGRAASWSARIGPAGSTATAAISASGSSFAPACRRAWPTCSTTPRPQAACSLALSADEAPTGNRGADQALEPWPTRIGVVVSSKGSLLTVR